MNVQLALSGLGYALFCMVATVFLVAVAILATGGIVYAFAYTGKYLLKNIHDIPADLAKEPAKNGKKAAT